MKIIFGGEAKSEELNKRTQSTANNRIIQTSAPQSARVESQQTDRLVQEWLSHQMRQSGRFLNDTVTDYLDTACPHCVFVGKH